MGLREPRMPGQPGSRSWFTLEEGQIPANGNGEWIAGIYFSRGQLAMLRASTDPRLTCAKQMAHASGFSYAYARTCLEGIYKRMEWRSPSIRLLTMWSMAHAAELGVTHDWRNGYERGGSSSNKRGLIEVIR